MRSRYLLYVLLICIATFSTISTGHADLIIDGWSFATIPESGNIAGPPGSTIGWGYTISNDDPDNWLVLIGLNADIFQQGATALIFDFPIVAPGSLLSVPYDGFNGLYQLTWDLSAPIGFVNSGTFTLSAEYWNGDPLTGGTFIESAQDRSSPYKATVIPEPSTFLLLGAGLAGMGLLRRKFKKIA
ncbi:conserved exported hypothetical protein [Candidatus Sulfobium mesophilum]|uniref:Ice-binding protein C-terminal domain-containing protein n=1 Tax=Candidatus Sulfobium mesophilum TaxID=2016548 RepID=A0A2U3QKW3_9BACT|nr:conserved exported hypothetical protein [Candidatus Sulfobium mesophilum]